jgi:hypothetical protein
VEENYHGYSKEEWEKLEKIYNDYDREEFISIKPDYHGYSKKEWERLAHSFHSDENDKNPEFYTVYYSEAYEQQDGEYELWSYVHDEEIAAILFPGAIKKTEGEETFFVLHLSYEEVLKFLKENRNACLFYSKKRACIRMDLNYEQKDKLLRLSKE